MAEGQLALFYDDQAGEAAVVTFDANGDISKSWEFKGWRKTWQFVPGRFTSASFGESEVREILLYDRLAGEAITLTVSSDGHVLQSPIMTFRTSWDLIAARNLLPYGTDKIQRDQAFLYDRAAGEAAIVDLGGSVSHTLTGFRKSWDLCDSGQFFKPKTTAEPSGQVLLYDRAAGVVAVLGFDEQGAMKYDKGSGGFRSSYSHLATGSFLGNGNSQVVFYDNGDGMLLCVGVGEDGPKTLSGNSILPGCEHLVVGRFGDGSRARVFTYKRTSGEAAFVEFDHDGQVAVNRPYSGWRKSWDIVTALHAGKQERVLLYDRNAGDVCVLSFPSGDTSQRTSTNLRRTWSHIVSLGPAFEDRRR